MNSPSIDWLFELYPSVSPPDFMVRNFYGDYFWIIAAYFHVYPSPRKLYQAALGDFISHENGVICINKITLGLAGVERVQSDMAHEFRHHMQKLSGVKPDQIIFANVSGATHIERLIKYYSLSATEMDALLFQNKISPCEQTVFLEKAIRDSMPPEQIKMLELEYD